MGSGASIAQECVPCFGSILLSNSDLLALLLEYLSCTDVLFLIAASPYTRNSVPNDFTACAILAGNSQLWLMEEDETSRGRPKATESITAVRDDMIKSLPPAQLHGLLKFRSRWVDPCYSCQKHNLRLFCWSLIQRLALKPQFCRRLLGASEIPENVGDVLCLAVDSSIDRMPSDGWKKTLECVNMDVLFLGALRSGGLMLLQHRLFSLDSCRGSPDSPAGLEHSSWILLAQDWNSLMDYLINAGPKQLQKDVEQRLGLDLKLCTCEGAGCHEDIKIPPFGHPDSWVAAYPENAIFNTLDNFIRAFKDTNV